MYLLSLVSIIITRYQYISRFGFLYLLSLFYHHLSFHFGAPGRVDLFRTLGRLIVF